MKTRYLLIWDYEKGVHKKYFLNPSLKKYKDEEHYFIGPFAGTI